MLKINSLINSIPRCVFGMLIVLGIVNIFFNAEDQFVVITSAIACGCFAYVLASKYAK